MFKLSTSFVALCLFSSVAFALPAKEECSKPTTVTVYATATSTSTSTVLPTATSKVEANDAAHHAGKIYFGTATDNGYWSDKDYLKIVSDNHMFGQITPENNMKWMYTEPSRGVFNFTDSDALVKFAEKNGQILRGHNCVWYNQLPSWLTSGTWDAKTLASIVEEHCHTLVNHYKGKIYSWDVINEPFNDDGTWRTTMFYNTLNTTYIPLALEAARKADPHAKLYINDYNIEGQGAKSTAMINLIKDLKARKVPIDGVGIQGHLIVGELPSTIEQNLRDITATGVEVAITELDIRMNLPETPALLEQQKKDYETVISACRNVKGCVGVTIWEFADQYSWVPSTFSGQGGALPWNEQYVKKPAYDGIIAGFE
ncbi:hypothetical protein H0H93_013935 [Arthromyces matolae]|nr:hypothetical protein H0H93_013935 [Arthromyces matolae]